MSKKKIDSIHFDLLVFVVSVFLPPLFLLYPDLWSSVSKSSENRNVKTAQSAIFTTLKLLRLKRWTRSNQTANRSKSHKFAILICSHLRSFPFEFYMCATHQPILILMHSIFIPCIQFSMRCIRPHCVVIQPPSYILWFPLPSQHTHTHTNDQVFRLVMWSWALQ